MLAAILIYGGAATVLMSTLARDLRGIVAGTLCIAAGALLLLLADTHLGWTP